MRTLIGGIIWFAGVVFLPFFPGPAPTFLSVESRRSCDGCFRTAFKELPSFDPGVDRGSDIETPFSLVRIVGVTGIAAISFRL